MLASSEIIRGNYLMYKLRKTIIASVISAVAMLSVPLVSQASQVGFIDPMQITLKADASSSLLERVLQNDDEQKRYEGVVGFIEHYGQWVTLSSSAGLPARINVVSYLMQTKRGELAANLLKNGVLEGWVSYRFMDGVANDFVFALQNQDKAYLKALFTEAPKGLNSPLIVRTDGAPILPLALLATNEYTKSPFYSEVVTAMLEAGANPHQKMESGISPMLVASSSNNMLFVRVVNDFIENQSKGVQGLLSNTPLSSHEMIEMQELADTLIEQTNEEKSQYNYDRLHNMWVQMILKGYNLPADQLYAELKKRPEFDINQRATGGLSALMAAAMSPLYGGNVDYAKTLVKGGADPQQLIEIQGDDGEVIKVNLIQLALQKDNFKIVAYLITQGVNFITVPGEDDVFMLSEAMEQKAFLSATILKEALSKILAEQASGE